MFMQKKKLFLSLFALCSIVGMSITSCNNQGEQGPIGPEGPQGPEGPAGENGEDGKDGKKFDNYFVFKLACAL